MLQYLHLPSVLTTRTKWSAPNFIATSFFETEKTYYSKHNLKFRNIKAK